MTQRPPDQRTGQRDGQRDAQRDHGRVRRFLVADQSMLPTLQPGQGLVGWRTQRVRVGELRCVEHPGRPGFWLVKRVHSLPTRDTMELRSDNPDVTMADSRSFGPVPVDRTWRVVVRIPLRLM